jgi:tRNA-uridine 2-sulfurtransferase
MKNSSASLHSSSHPNSRPNSLQACSATTVVVGMSGGVDSSVAAQLLREQGYRVIGLFMKNWEEKDENGVCSSAKDYADVARVCDRLDIPYYGVEFVREYREHVFAHFLAEYEAGYTPNPDILCNREIKFNVFMKKALEEVGGDFLATGHYARVGEGASLLKGVDPGKDQSYFLYTLKKEILSRVLFPVGELPKSEVRRLAGEAGLSTAAKKDSTGICFIGERNFTRFLGQYVKAKRGRIRTLAGEDLGGHAGVCFYTLGQRKGLGLGGEGEAYFVVGKDPARGIVYAERGQRHPALYCDTLTATELSWVSGEAPGPLPFRCTAKARYRQQDVPCVITAIQEGRATVAFDEPQRAITPRQSIVFYSGETCLGGGMIEEPGPSYYEMGRDLPNGLSPDPATPPASV